MDTDTGHCTGCRACLTIGGSAAQDLDLSKDCSLTVSPGGEETAAELAQAGVVVDLYKVRGESRQRRRCIWFSDAGGLWQPDSRGRAGQRGLAETGAGAAGIALGVAPGTEAKPPSLQGAPLGTAIGQ